MTQTLSPIDAKKASFGRSQSFPLRVGWLPKIAQAAREDEAGLLRGDEDKLNAMISRWGVGKNMVASMQHWARATGVLESGGKSGSALTGLGKHLFGDNGVDPYLEDEATLWLLHWHIASRPNHFAANYWLFNQCFYPTFTAEQALEALNKYLKELGAKTSLAMMKRDLGVALRLYAGRRRVENTDDLDTPFLSLGLFSYSDSLKEYVTEFGRRDSLPAAVVGFAAAQLMRATEVSTLPVRGNFSRDGYATMEYSFRLTGDALLEKLDAFCDSIEEFQLHEVAGVWQLQCQGSMPEESALLDIIYG